MQQASISLIPTASLAHSTEMKRLTLSLPWCHLKTTINSANLKPLSLFVFVFFLHWHVKGFSSKRNSIEGKRVTGPGNILFEGASVHILDRKFYRLRQ